MEKNRMLDAKLMAVVVALSAQMGMSVQATAATLADLGIDAGVKGCAVQRDAEILDGVLVVSDRVVAGGCWL